MAKVTIRVDFSKYKYVDLSLDEAINIISLLPQAMGKDSVDVRETLRFLKNFDEFYEYMRKKFKDYLVPPHKPDDYIRGRVVIDKIKLYKAEDGSKRVVIVFDRGVPQSILERLFREAGYEVEIQKEF